jgi:hypothetical protein
MAIAVHSNLEYVHRAKCGFCGCSGPGGGTTQAGRFLATLSGWNPDTGYCAACTKATAEGAITPEKSPAKRRKAMKEQTP